MITLADLVITGLVPGVLALLGVWMWRVPRRGQALFARDEIAAYWHGGMSFALWAGLVAVMCLLMHKGSGSWPPRESQKVIPIVVAALTIASLVVLRLLTPVEGKHHRYWLTLPLGSLALASVAVVGAHYTVPTWPRGLMLAQLLLASIALIGVFDVSRRRPIWTSAAVLLCTIAGAAIITMRGSIDYGPGAGILASLAVSGIVLASLRGVSTPVVWWIHAALIYQLLVSNTFYFSPAYAIAGIAFAPLWLLLPGRAGGMMAVRVALIVLTLGASVVPSFLPDNAAAEEDDSSSFYR